MFPKPGGSRARRARRAERRYRTLAREWLGVGRLCEVCHAARASQVHHRRGRGARLLEVSWWLAVCAACHAEIHASPAWAYAAGYLVRREGES